MKIQQSFKTLSHLILVAMAFMATQITVGYADVLPKNWQLNMLEAASPVKEKVHDFHNLLLPIITGIVVFVTALLFYTLIRFRRSKNPVPSKTTHNVAVEVLWTIIPCLILIVIAVPSFKLLYYQDRVAEPEMTLKVTGYQWYWGYEYPDHGGFSFLSYMIPDEEIKPGQQRLLETDNVVVLPVDTDIRILVTSADVLHSWAMPAFGVKKDAVPGRLNETWVRINKPGTYYGQCSELCGINHAYMPVQVEAVSKEEFAAWVEKAKDEF